MRIKLLVFAFALGTTAVKAQFNVGSANAPDPSAVMQLTSGGTKGFLGPSVALTDTAKAAPVTSPATGLLVYNTATVPAGTGANVNPGYYYYTGTIWARLITTVGAVGDIKLIGSGNHISSDAGLGSNGTSAGTGGGNIAIGQGALNANTATSNLVSIGISALSNNTTGSQNLAVGFEALKSNTSGDNNNAIGCEALGNNTTGRINTAMGFSALYRNTTGGFNVGIGFQAVASNVTGSNNIGIGYATIGQTNGSDNTGLGHYSLSSATTGSSNTAVGSYAGSNLTTGSSNIAIGYNTNLISTTGSNQLNIGNSIYGTGIGSGGVNIGINNTAPAYTLDVTGDINASGAVRTSGVAITSDARLKKNIVPVKNALADVMQLNAVTYDKKSNFTATSYDRSEIGFVAQEVRKVFPALVYEDKSANKLLAVDYNSLIPVLTKAIQEQQKSIQDQQAEIAELRSQISKLVADKAETKKDAEK